MECFLIFCNLDCNPTASMVMITITFMTIIMTIIMTITHFRNLILTAKYPFVKAAASKKSTLDVLYNLMMRNIDQIPILISGGRKRNFDLISNVSDV